MNFQACCERQIGDWLHRQVPLLNPLPTQTALLFGRRRQPSPRPKNIAYYFGTFNPIHNGHIQVALAAIRQFHFDKVVFVPVFSAPHKDNVHMPSFAQRYEMIRRAIKDYPMLDVSDIESRLPAPSYSAQTVQALKRTDPRRRLPFIIGVDALKGLKGWHEPMYLLKHLRFIVAPRDGERMPSTVTLDGLRMQLSRKKIRMPEVTLSSTMVRDAVAAGQSIAPMVHEDVDAFIRSEKLYRNVEGTSHA